MSEKRMNGAQALLQCMEKEGVEYVYGIPGGTAIPLLDAIYDSKIKFILTRHEQGATHMADGYARATGKVGVVFCTSGPGATNTITGIMTAMMDSIPMIVISAQVDSRVLGTDAFQEADVFSMSIPIVKHSYHINNVQDIPRIIKEAFYIANTGRPGPVVIDLPKNISMSPFTGELDAEMDLPGYRISATLNPDSIEKMARLINQSRRPLIIAGHGVLISKADGLLGKLAEKLQAPVCTTLLGKGAFPDSNALSLGMLGMHGTGYANRALVECDLVLGIGCRWDDRINGNPGKFAPLAKKIHIDIDPSEIRKIIKPDAYCVGDASLVLDALLPKVERLNTKMWLKTINKLKRQYPLKYRKQGGLKAAHVLDELNAVLKGDAIVVTDVGQTQMWAAQYMHINKRDSWLSSGGAGTMGYGLPGAIGAQIGRPKDIVVAILGDGGFQMTQAELATARIHKLPIKIFIMDNKYLGMVRQWQQLFFNSRYSGVDLVGNPDFVKLAEAHAIKAFRIKRGADIRKVLAKAMAVKNGPCIIHCEVTREDNVFPMIPAGKAADEMLLERPRHKIDNPTGST